MDTNQQIQAYTSGARFGPTPIPRHIHNNIDSPYVFQPFMVYGGSIKSGATASFIPKGWTISRLSTGHYVMTHNLNTLLYSITTTVNNTVTTIVVNAVPSLNSVSFQGVDVNTGAASSAAVDVAFMFTLVVVNNRSQQPPSYQGSLIS